MILVENLLNFLIGLGLMFFSLIIIYICYSLKAFKSESEYYFAKKKK
jgi:hypothetical protein